MTKEELEDFIRNNLTLETKTERLSYGMGNHVKVFLKLNNEIISEVYLDIPQEKE